MNIEVSASGEPRQRLVRLTERHPERAGHVRDHQTPLPVRGQFEQPLLDLDVDMVGASVLSPKPQHTSTEPPTAEETNGWKNQQP